MAKKSDTPTQKINFAVPVKMLEDIRQLREIDGCTMTELLQGLLYDGLHRRFHNANHIATSPLYEPKEDAETRDVLFRDVLRANAKLIAHILEDYIAPGEYEKSLDDEI